MSIDIFRDDFLRKVEYYVTELALSREQAEARARWNVGHPGVDDGTGISGANLCLEVDCNCGRPRTIEEARARRQRLWTGNTGA